MFSISWDNFKKRVNPECDFCRRIKQSNNLIGKTFGYITVLDRDFDYKQRNQVHSNDAYWICRCQCGKTFSTSTQALVSGRTKSCGCYHKEIVSKNLSGQIIGCWKIIEKVQSRSYGNNNNLTYYKCECLKCGTIKEVRADHLVTGRSFSCGCVKSKGEEKIKQILKENNILFTCEKIFNSCKFKDTNRLAKFDFYVNNAFLLEYDGEQHFSTSPSGFFTKEDLNKIAERDNYKNQWCKENNIPLKRIPYWELDNITINNIMDDTFLVT